MAALVMVILAIVIVGTIGLGFIAQTEQKQSGAALTFASTNAMFLAESGLRYAEECLLLGDANCPCASWTGGCSGWAAPNPQSFSPVEFGDSGGTFEVQFTDTGNASTLKVTSLGKYAGAIRSMSKIIAKACPFTENAITSCTPITNVNNASIEPPTATTSDGNCDIPAVPALPTFPGDPTNCPSSPSDYTNYTGANLGSGDHKICSWSVSGNGSYTVGANGQTTTIYVAKNFSIANNATITFLGDVTVYVTGTTLTSDNAVVNLGSAANDASMTLQSQGAFTMKNNSKMNPGPVPVIDNDPGDPAWLFVMVGGAATVDDAGDTANNVTFHGGLYGDNLSISMNNNTSFVGSIVAKSVSLSNNATLTYDAGAGVEAGGYGTCGGGGGTSSIPVEG